VTRRFERGASSSSDLMERGSTRDYLSDPAIAASYSAREHESYSRSLKPLERGAPFTRSVQRSHIQALFRPIAPR
jgi:hypothetical protein